MDDSEYYLQATKEVDSNNVIEALWAKSMALCSGDERQAKYKYIKLRVALLSSGVEDQQVSQNNPNPQESGMSDSIPIEESARELGIHPRTKPPEKHLNQYMPIQEFASITGIAVEDLIKNIGDDLLSGKFENGEWLVCKGQVDEWIGRKGQEDTSFVVGESKRDDAEHSDPDSHVNENSLDTLADPLTESGTNQQDKSEEYRKSFLSAHQFATANGTTVEKVIQDIRDGELVGEIRDGSWYVQTRLTTSDSDDDAELKRDFMPITQFSDATNLTIETIIDKIRAGEIRGEIRDGSWFVRNGQVGTNLTIKATPSALGLSVGRDTRMLVDREGNDTQSMSTHRTIADSTAKKSPPELKEDTPSATIDIGRSFRGNWMAPAGLSLGIVSVFLSFIGLIPLSGLIISLLGIRRANEVKMGRSMSLWATGLNLLYFILGLRIRYALDADVVGLMIVFGAIVFVVVLVSSRETRG